MEIYQFLDKLKFNKNNMQINLFPVINKEHKYYYLLNLIDNSKHKDLFLVFITEYFKIKSGFNKILKYPLEYDQSSSGPMIYSILSQDKNMAYQTNLISRNIKNDLYNNFLILFKEKMYKEELLTKDELKYFNRSDFSKKLLMPKFYNMTDKGIRSLLQKIIVNNNLFENLNHKAKKMKIDRLILYINLLLNQNYSETIKFQESLVNICKLLTNQNLPVVFYTLDGSLIRYKYLKFDVKFGSIKKNDLKRKTYKIYIPIKDNDKNIVSSRHHATFPPNYIQSLDAALCRMIIYTFYKITNKILEPLHDSFRVSVTDLKLLTNIIKYIYIYNFLNENFHNYRIGLNTKTFNIEFDSNFYLNYKKYFNFNNLNKKDLIFSYFIENSLVSLEDKELMLKMHKKELTINQIFNKKIIKKIINSYFIFYF